MDPPAPTGVPPAGVFARLGAIAGAVATAIWLVPASVHIVSWPASGPVRVALLAPLSTFLAVTAIVVAVVAAAAIAWHKSGRAIDALARAGMPLTLLLLWAVPYLPWLADRAPLVLVLAGPLKWVIAAAAMGGVVAPPLTRAQLTRSIVVGRSAVFIISLTLYALLGLRSLGEIGLGGDEPHYLVIAHSLLTDGDLEIGNNHARRDYRGFYGGDLKPHFVQRGRNGEIYSIHAPGLPAILLPAYAAAGAPGAVVFVALMAALTALAIFDIAALVSSPRVAALVWAACCLTVPFVPHAWLIYPEMAAALVVAWAVRSWWRPPASNAALVVLGAALGVLPWLHTKFAVLLAMLALIEAARLWPRMKSIAAFLGPIALSGVAWLLSFYWMYGVLDPRAPYGTSSQTDMLAANIPRGTLGLLFDQKFGLLVYSPVFVLAAVGAWTMLRERKWRVPAAGLLATAAAFFITTTRFYMWWGGSSAPARFLVPLVPLAAPLLAIAMARLRGTIGHALAGGTMVASLAIAAVTIGAPREEFLFSAPHGVASLVAAVQGSAPLDVLLPTFTAENWQAPALLLLPWTIAAAVALALTTVCVRRNIVRSPFWAATVAAVTMFVAGSAAAPAPATASRRAVVVRGQLALLDAYDPARLRAVDYRHRTRLSADEILGAAIVTVRNPTDGESDEGTATPIGPVQLPQGKYRAHVWDRRGALHAQEVFVGLSDRVTLARAQESPESPLSVSFEMTIGGPVYIGVSPLNAMKGVRRVDIQPETIVPRSERIPMTILGVEPVDGRGPGFIAYVDHSTYPEDGVFWTKDTDAGTVVIATVSAATLRLTLHVGASGGPVELDADGTRIDVDLKPDETRDVRIPIAKGAPQIVLRTRAARSFVPAEVDRSSSDRRHLGCQVRPHLE